MLPYYIAPVSMDVENVGSRFRASCARSSFMVALIITHFRVGQSLLRTIARKYPKAGDLDTLANVWRAMIDMES
jgi:hypothetical protein